MKLLLNLLDKNLNNNYESPRKFTWDDEILIRFYLMDPLTLTVNSSYFR